jgi:hypothetical protein
LIEAYGADCPMLELLNHLAAPSCRRLGFNWDGCAVQYLEAVQ